MKLDINFTNLENLVKNMGASTVIWKIPITQAKVKTEFGEIDFSKLATTGVTIDLIDAHYESNGRATTPDGEQILLHIKDVNSHYGLPKFHFSQCRTLKDMENKGKFEKYVMTRRKDGYFIIDKKIGYNEYKQNCEEKLDVCKNCLNWYNKNYRKYYSVETFDIVEFFEHFDQSPIHRKPTHTDTSAPKSGYTENWDLISRQRKEQCGYVCQQCDIDLSGRKNLMQTHHANGVKSDNSSSNLKVLCIECHSNQPSHGHMKSSASREISEIQRIRAIHRF